MATFRGKYGPTQPDLQLIGEALDGLEAVHRAQKLQPDLILLDIGLPTLNGIEAAVRIRLLSPRSKILFLSENRSWDIAKEALRSGGSGYVLKSDAGSDLLRAVEAVLKGKQFISTSLAGHDLSDSSDECLLRCASFGSVLSKGNVAYLSRDAHRSSS